MCFGFSSWDIRLLVCVISQAFGAFVQHLRRHLLSPPGRRALAWHLLLANAGVFVWWKIPQALSIECLKCGSFGVVGLLVTNVLYCT